MAEAVRTKRTVMQGIADTAANYPDPNALAEPSASPAGTKAIIPIYDAFNTLQTEMETNPMNRARSTLDPERFWIGITTYRIQGNFYVYGTGQDTDGYLGAGGGVTTNDLAGAMEELPPWAKSFLPAAGFTPSYVASDEFIRFNPVSDTFWHAYFEVYLNKYLHKMYGSRGNLVFSAQASNPVQAAFDYMGLYQKATVTSNISDSGTDPGLPPRLCGIDSLFLRSEGISTAFKPNLKSFSLNLGATPAQRRNANVVGCIQEIGIFQEFNPRLTLTFEVDDFDAQLGSVAGVDVDDFIEAARSGMNFSFELNIGPYTDTSLQGKRWQFRNYQDAGDAPSTDNLPTMIEANNNYRMSMVSAPQYVDVDGIRCYECEFLLGGTDNNFLEIIAM